MAIDKITTASITDGTIATADIADGAVTSVKTTGVGGANTPAFHASLSATASISDATDTKLACNTELYDTDNAYDNSTNYRFTPQTAGKYLIYGSMTSTESIDNNMVNVGLMVHKNGSRVDYFGINFRHNYVRTVEISGSTVVDMNGSSDYVELFVFADTDQNSPTIIGGTNQKCFFGGYKLIT
tara:strand:+ start:1375 stop:1926 length:552 start_codon:yes stop_codon:yes gene_type:complete